MGTHPIFESDFDCLTENSQNMDYDDQLRLDCVKTGDPLNKRFSRAPDTSVDALAKEFEDEMEMELDCVFQKQQNTWSTSTTAAPRTSIEAPGPSSNTKYDDAHMLDSGRDPTSMRTENR